MTHLPSLGLVLEELAKKNGFVLYTGREQDFKINRERTYRRGMWPFQTTHIEKQHLATVIHLPCDRAKETKLNITFIQIHGEETENLIENFVDEMIATLHSGKKPPQRLLTQKYLHSWKDKYPAWDL